MDEMQVYAENKRLFAAGIDSGITKSPYRLTNEELDGLEKALEEHSARLGEQAVLVEWGQPFGGPISGRKYHPQAEVQRLREGYAEHRMRGICPMAGFVVDALWIKEQRERLDRIAREGKREFDPDAYWKFVRTTNF